MSNTSVMWFRRDLRATDNMALSKCIANNNNIILIFIIDPKQITTKNNANQSSFFASVAKFKSSLSNKKIRLHIFKGDVSDVFTNLKQSIPDLKNIYFNFDECGYGRARDQKTIKYCTESLGITMHPFLDFTLHGATDIKKQDGAGYKMFTPYFKQWIQRAKKKPVTPLHIYEIMQKKTTLSITDNATDLNSLVDSKYRSTYEDLTGEIVAHKVLKKFIINKLESYDSNRDVPFLDATSHLSRYLRTGEISIRTVYEAAIQEPASNGQSTFIKELAWRDYYNMIYAIYPNQKQQAIKLNFQNIQWENNKSLFEAWKKGQTGFPIIDAAMRQLSQTGWMHNRLRMVVASFLTKDLLIDWRWGELYFQKKLVDYDSASNIGGWQWAASTGTDSVPYFRIFNPTTQSQKFDPEGRFIKKYVPELRQVPNQKIHCPNKLSYEEQTNYAVILEKDYPKPIVDHKVSRLNALKVYKQCQL